VNSGEGKQQSAQEALARAQKQWQTVLGELQLQMTRATFDTWLRGSRVIAYQEDRYTVLVRHAYAVDWLENRLLHLIERTLQRREGPDARVIFTARPPEKNENLVLVPETVPEAPIAERIVTQEKDRGNGHVESANLNPQYTFRTFVVGANNRLAHAASLAVAENPAHAYNPLFIYGGVGLGKTHLLHALGHEAQNHGLSVLYVSSEGFTNDLIGAIRSQETNDFRAMYRTNDVLLVDDVQFLIGKERTQEEFFHTFNALHSAGKQIVITCDRPPKALVALEDRLRSRFGWGLIADVQPPDFETRMAILRNKADALGEHIPDEVLAYVARKVLNNIRELEGSLNCVLAHARLMNKPLNVETARTALEDILERAVDLSPEQIVIAVAHHYGLTKKDLIGRSRRRAVSRPRQLAMYLIREEVGTSLPQIGKLLGGRDHSTIVHGCEKIGDEIEADEQLRRDWLAIKETLSGGRRAG
jgi:chromosomal replication initiator protein